MKSLCLLVLLASPTTDWDKLYKEARVGHTVRVLVKNVSTLPPGSSFAVVLQDGKWEHIFGRAVFYNTTTGSFNFSLSSTLRRMKHAPSKKARIYLRGENGVEVKFSSIEISVIKQK